MPGDDLPQSRSVDPIIADRKLPVGGGIGNADAYVRSIVRSFVMARGRSSADADAMKHAVANAGE